VFHVDLNVNEFKQIGFIRCLIPNVPNVLLLVAKMHQIAQNCILKFKNPQHYPLQTGTRHQKIAD